MSAITVAKKDFKGARRAKTLWLIAALLALVAGLFAYVFEPAVGLNETQSDAQTVRELFNNLSVIMSFLLPIVVMVASYLAIAGERESGGIKFLLGLPNTRRDIVLGKYASRTVIATLSVVFMFGVAMAIALVRFGAFPATVVLGVTLVTVVYAAVFVSVAVAMSAFVRTRSRAIAGAIGVYFGLVLLNFLPVISLQNIVRYLHHDLLGMATNEHLYEFVLHVTPLFAFQKARNFVLPDDMTVYMFAEEGARSELPFYLSDEFSVLILAFWLVVPVVVGYFRFERADID